MMNGAPREPDAARSDDRAFRIGIQTPDKQNLSWSELIGPPSLVFDADDLMHAPELVPGKAGPSMRWANRHTIVKFGSTVQLAEAEAMYLVKAKTNVGCPKLFSAYTLDGITYIGMSYEPHQVLAEYWEDASHEQRELVVAQLQDFVKQMRSMKSHFVGGPNRSPCHDGMFWWDYRGDEVPYGPYDSLEAFNEGLIEAYNNTTPPTAESLDRNSSAFNRKWEFEQLIRSLAGYEIVFTHGDLHDENIGVKEDGSVIIFDWQTAGFWPEYWEFYKAMFHGSDHLDLVRQIERFVPPFYKESFVMNYIWNKMCGTPGGPK